MNGKYTIACLLIMLLAFGATSTNAGTTYIDQKFDKVVVEYLQAGGSGNSFTEIPSAGRSETKNSCTLTFRNELWQVVIRQIVRDDFVEVNGELESLSGKDACVTLRICFPQQGKKYLWYEGLDHSRNMTPDVICYDTVAVATAWPPDGAFNGSDLANGGYGNAVGRGTMSFYPLCAISVDGQGQGLGIDMSVPLVYRLGAEVNKGLLAEFDVATSSLTDKFPNRAFFKLCTFCFDGDWGMRAALEHYYAIYPESFKKRVPVEGIWLPFTPLRSIAGWEDFGFAFHETAWNSNDVKDSDRIPTIISDKGTGVLSFQYTEPWDIQIPIREKNLPYEAVTSGNLIPEEHREYLNTSATLDKNGQNQARRLETPWFESGWAVSITTNCDPDIPGFNRYQYVLKDEITPATKMNVDGIYFDSMEWNWHHDLNYRSDHFKYTDYPLTFSANALKPAIWNFVSEFEMMKKIADEMHVQGKLAMGNGHGWNPFAASNLDLFGAELSWYYSGDHNTKALDFKRAISCQKPIVFLLNEGLNDPAFTEAPYKGYEVYFEKLMAYGFFPSFFSVDASNDPYWQDKKKIENGRPFFKKYIPIIREIAAAGWQPVTYAKCSNADIRVERFGSRANLYFTLRNNGTTDAKCMIQLEPDKLGLTGLKGASELVTGNQLKSDGNKLVVDVPAGRTRVIRIME